MVLRNVAHIAIAFCSIEHFTCQIKQKPCGFFLVILHSIKTFLFHRRDSVVVVSLFVNLDELKL